MTTTVEILDRTDMHDKLMDAIRLNPRETAVITIDMHRGHLDPEIATMPASVEDSKRVIANGADALDFARAQGVPVIHVILVFRKIPGLGSEGMTQPFWQAVTDITDEANRLSPGRKSTVDDHNIEGRPQTEIIPELFRDGDYVINNKKRLDCFHGTDLENLLHILGVKNVCLMGINTNTCVQNTAFTAFNLDKRVVVMSDCVASMYGDDLHALGLQNIQRCLGWVLSNEEFKEKIEEGRKLNA